MFPAIKLYAKTSVTWKSKTIKEAEKEVKEFADKKIKHEIQKAEYFIKPTKRKQKPLDVEVTYFDFETIEQIVKDNKDGEE